MTEAGCRRTLRLPGAHSVPTPSVREAWMLSARPVGTTAAACRHRTSCRRVALDVCPQSSSRRRATRRDLFRDRSATVPDRDRYWDGDSGVPKNDCRIRHVGMDRHDAERTRRENGRDIRIAGRYHALALPPDRGSAPRPGPQTGPALASTQRDRAGRSATEFIGIRCILKIYKKNDYSPQDWSTATDDD